MIHKYLEKNFSVGCLKRQWAKLHAKIAISDLEPHP